MPPGAIASIALLFALALWAAGHLALAPGLTNKGQESARALLSASYLTRYIEQTGSVAEPDSRPDALPTGGWARPAGGTALGGHGREQEVHARGALPGSGTLQ